MKTFIITEGGSSIGFGHITRCVALYQAFESAGIIPTFIINSDTPIIDYTHHRFNWALDSDRLLKIIAGADIAIIDSYLADEYCYRQVSDVTKIPFFIDDINRIDYPRGIVLNTNAHATDIAYPRRSDTSYLLGGEYTILRKEFWNVSRKEHQDDVTSIMITFGGADPCNVTPSALELVCKYYPGIIKNVVIGNCFGNTDAIVSAADEKTNLFFSPDATGIIKIMLSSDIAISAGGQTLYELTALGIPTLAIVVAKNQQAHVHKLVTNGIILYGGSYKDLDTIKKHLDFLFLPETRKSLLKNGSGTVNKMGSKEIIKYLKRASA